MRFLFFSLLAIGNTIPRAPYYKFTPETLLYLFRALPWQFSKSGSPLRVILLERGTICGIFGVVL